MKFFIIFNLLFINLAKSEFFDYPILSQNFNDPNMSSIQLTDEKMDGFINDNLNIISPQFKTPSFLKSRVKFWLSIYSLYDNNSVVFHDKSNPEIIYNILDLSSFKNLNNPFIEENIVNALISEKLKNLKNAIKSISNNKKDPLTQEIIQALTKAKIKEPKNYEKSKFYNSLIKNLRYQRGQKNQIEKSILNYMPYKPYLEYLAEKFGLPHEVILISFLESSFNQNAQSKAGAVGVWQIMPYISKKFFPENKIDYRKNPILSAYPAFYLLEENKRQLKYWDLAISAYNSGYKHILKAKKKFKLKNISLIDLVTKYKDNDFGFASINYYSEFLALVHAFTYKDQIYHSHNYQSKLKFDKLYIYISNCDGFLPHESLLQINNHLKTLKIDRGTIFVSNQSIESKNFTLVADEDYLNTPSTWKFNKCLK
jgi:membrane-bound lytic murein transglycosylase D